MSALAKKKNCNTASHQRAEIIAARHTCACGSSSGQPRTAAANSVLPAAAHVVGTHQPSRSLFTVAPAKAVAQAAHQPPVCEPATTAITQRRQRVPLGALPRKVHVLWPHAPALVHPLRAEVVRCNQAQVARAERAAVRWPCAVGGQVNRPSPSRLVESAPNDACLTVHMRFCLQAFDAYTGTVLNCWCMRRTSVH
jgi:hypothetical protein